MRNAKLLILVPLKCRIDSEPELIEIQQQEMFGATKEWILKNTYRFLDSFRFYRKTGTDCQLIGLIMVLNSFLFLFFKGPCVKSQDQRNEDS